ncbi:MAG TPA: serine hydrolase [Lachnoclostridium sp.]|uniref:serine hydrolase n=1 Tax=Lacrimispora sp. TaxID=2719234 RepID=UPI000EC2A3B9|nr:serine hydrolase [Lacrimispora sp.]HCD46221.1 serine hydrolase [Lachnoclostridium sp.]
MKDEIIKKLEQLPGKIGFFYENLKTGDGFAHHEQEPMMAASVIKLFVMTAAFEKEKKGTFQMDELFAVKREDCVPSCGALTYLHDGILVTGMDLITLMIIFSDNTATNILIDILGMDEINETIWGLGFRQTLLQRKMYDMESSAQGIQNYITAYETGRLLKMMYDGILIDRQSSETMISILKNQQLCSKIPFYLQALSDSPEIAHKTGEDTGITHDVGIVYGMEPFLICFCGNETDTPAFERIMAEISLDLFKQVNKEI